MIWGAFIDENYKHLFKFQKFITNAAAHKTKNLLCWQSSEWQSFQGTLKNKNKNQTNLKGAIVGHDKNKENDIKIKTMFSSKSLLSLGWLT